MRLSSVDAGIVMLPQDETPTVVERLQNAILYVVVIGAGLVHDTAQSVVATDPLHTVVAYAMALSQHPFTGREP